jgi:hypothetical protein
MALGSAQIGSLAVSKMILGGNPFSGFSHQTPERDQEMRRYYTADRIKSTLSEAESLGINAFVGRADRHVSRLLLEYWDQGGEIQWIAQTCTEFAPHTRGISNAIAGGASACYIHGGQMDYWLAQRETDPIRECVDMIHDAGLPAGIAGHTTSVFEWAEQHLDLDFYMCCYYNPSRRDERAEHVSGSVEYFAPEDRTAMVQLIAHLSKPVIHYKVLAAGRNDPQQAFDFVAQHLRPQDAVCLGVYTKDKLDMLAEDLTLLEQACARIQKERQAI